MIGFARFGSAALLANWWLRFRLASRPAARSLAGNLQGWPGSGETDSKTSHQCWRANWPTASGRRPAGERCGCERQTRARLPLLAAAASNGKSKSKSKSETRAKANSLRRLMLSISPNQSGQRYLLTQLVLQSQLALKVLVLDTATHRSSRKEWPPAPFVSARKLPWRRRRRCQPIGSPFLARSRARAASQAAIVVTVARKRELWAPPLLCCATQGARRAKCGVQIDCARPLDAGPKLAAFACSPSGSGRFWASCGRSRAL